MKCSFTSTVDPDGGFLKWGSPLCQYLSSMLDSSIINQPFWGVDGEKKLFGGPSSCLGWRSWCLENGDALDNETPARVESTTTFYAGDFRRTWLRVFREFQLAVRGFPGMGVPPNGMFYNGKSLRWMIRGYPWVPLF